MSFARVLPLLACCVVGLSGRLCAGELTGRIRPPERVKSAEVLDRESKRTFPAHFDTKTGCFLVEDLPEGTYDVLLETDVGRIEGVNLRIPASDEQSVKTLTPGPSDRADLTDLAAWLIARTPRKEALPTLGGVVLTMTGGKVSGVSLQPTGEKLADITVKLSDADLAVATGTLTGTVVFFKVRDELPTHVQVLLKLTGEEVQQVHIGQGDLQLPHADREWIVSWVANVKMFENKKRVLFIRGNDHSAKVLVEKIRDQKTTLPPADRSPMAGEGPAPEPTVFWRVEIWDFRKLHGGWEKTDYNVQQRHKMTLSEFRKLKWVFEPALGGLQVQNEGRTVVPDYHVPDKPDPAHGHTPY